MSQALRYVAERLELERYATVLRSQVRLGDITPSDARRMLATRAGAPGYTPAHRERLVQDVMKKEGWA